jgi:membrane-associated phospholipid phosphatase
LRITSLYIFTLETPEGIIPLVDPFLERVAYGGNAVFTKDLFFSGHTSTLFIIFLLEDKRNLKIVILISTILIGLLLIWQRVHYTIDVLGAVIVTSLVVEGIRWLNKRTFGSLI